MVLTDLSDDVLGFTIAVCKAIAVALEEIEFSITAAKREYSRNTQTDEEPSESAEGPGESIAEHEKTLYEKVIGDLEKDKELQAQREHLEALRRLELAEEKLKEHLSAEKQDYPYSECESLADKLTADGLLGVIFYKYRKLEVDWIVRRKREIDELFQKMIDMRQSGGAIPGPALIGWWINDINSRQLQFPASMQDPRIKPQVIKDNPQG